MPAPSKKPPAITSAIQPDLDAVKQFLVERIAKGAIAELVTAVLGLLMRMRDLNTELMKKLVSKSRQRPPSEALRRLQMELPFMWGSAANDGASPPKKKDEKARPKRGAKQPKTHGRPQLPEHLPRVPNVLVARTSKSASVQSQSSDAKFVYMTRIYANQPSLRRQVTDPLTNSKAELSRTVSSRLLAGHQYVYLRKSSIPVGRARSGDGRWLR